RVNDVKRTRLPANDIVLGTNCGGSDGNSGVTANPALGVASDLLVAQGGTSILGETAEIYGAAHLLTRRAVSRSVGEELAERMKWGARFLTRSPPGRAARRPRARFRAWARRSSRRGRSGRLCKSRFAAPRVFERGAGERPARRLAGRRNDSLVLTDHRSTTLR